MSATGLHMYLRRVDTQVTSMVPSWFTSKWSQALWKCFFKKALFYAPVFFKWVATTSEATSLTCFLVTKNLPFGLPAVSPSVA